MARCLVNTSRKSGVIRSRHELGRSCRSFPALKLRRRRDDGPPPDGSRPSSSSDALAPDSKLPPSNCRDASRALLGTTRAARRDGEFRREISGIEERVSRPPTLLPRR